MYIRNRMLKTEGGITLVALIVTIIILLILAAVSIMAITQFGIMDQAQAASAKYFDAEINELEKYEELNDKVDDIIEKMKKYE